MIIIPRGRTALHFVLFKEFLHLVLPQEEAPPPPVPLSFVVFDEDVQGW